jgi:hypothetical protein
MTDTTPTLRGTFDGEPIDARDTRILTERMAALDADERPRVGDYVRFTCGTLHRISHRWDDGAQTSMGGSFFLGNGYVEFSGGLDPAVPWHTLTRTDEIREGSVWFFHHGYMAAHNGAYCRAPFRVYECSVASDWRSRRAAFESEPEPEPIEDGWDGDPADLDPEDEAAQMRALGF